VGHRLYAPPPLEEPGSNHEGVSRAEEYDPTGTITHCSHVVWLSPGAAAVRAENAYQQQKQQYRSIPPVGNQSANGVASSTRGSSGSTAQNFSARRNDSEWQNVRYQQDRGLLLWRHASRCQYNAGKCLLTVRCASTKKLWGHIAYCMNPQCSVGHCVSSRVVLHHYRRRCKFARCPVCAIVREANRTHPPVWEGCTRRHQITPRHQNEQSLTMLRRTRVRFPAAIQPWRSPWEVGMFLQ
jgi:hypothetical protein